MPGASPVRAPDEVAGVAVHVDQTAVHLAANPVARIPVDVDCAARHLAADVTAGIAPDVDFPFRHLGADPVDARQVALELEARIGGIAADVEELRQRDLLVPVKNLEPLDLGECLATNGGRCQPLDFDWYGVFPVVAEAKASGLRHVPAHATSSGSCK